jgi:hypothetical protein
MLAVFVKSNFERCFSGTAKPGRRKRRRLRMTSEQSLSRKARTRALRLWCVVASVATERVEGGSCRMGGRVLGGEAEGLSGSERGEAAIEHR